MTSEENSVEQVAVERRERLKALRAAQELINTPNDDSPQTELALVETTQQKNLSNIKFRNYLPHDKQLQEGKLDPPVLPKFDDPIAAFVPPVSEKAEDPFLNIAPKKPNWDLRRDVQKKLEKLERRTQKAIIQVMEEEEKKNLAMADENGESAGD